MPERHSPVDSHQFDLIAHLFDSALARTSALAQAETTGAFDLLRAQLAQQLRIMARCVDDGSPGRTAVLHATYGYLQTVLATGDFDDRLALGAECEALIERLECGGEPLKHTA